MPLYFGWYRPTGAPCINPPVLFFMKSANFLSIIFALDLSTVRNELDCYYFISDFDLFGDFSKLSFIISISLSPFSNPGSRSPSASYISGKKWSSMNDCPSFHDAISLNLFIFFQSRTFTLIPVPSFMSFSLTASSGLNSLIGLHLSREVK